MHFCIIIIVAADPKFLQIYVVDVSHIALVSKWRDHRIIQLEALYNSHTHTHTLAGTLAHATHGYDEPNICDGARIPWTIMRYGSAVCVVCGGNAHACMRSMHHNFILSLLVFPQIVWWPSLPPPPHNRFPIVANRGAFGAYFTRWMLSLISCLVHCEREKSCAKWKIHLNDPMCCMFIKWKICKLNYSRARAGWMKLMSRECVCVCACGCGNATKSLHAISPCALCNIIARVTRSETSH